MNRITATLALVFAALCPSCLGPNGERAAYTGYTIGLSGARTNGMGGSTSDISRAPGQEGFGGVQLNQSDFDLDGTTMGAYVEFHFSF